MSPPYDPLSSVTHAERQMLKLVHEADVYVGQAIVDFDDRRYESALDNLKRALEIEPDHVEALYYTGVVHMAQRQPDQAVVFLERARAKAPTDASVVYQLGLAYFAQQQYDKASPLLEEVFRTNPTQDGLGYYVGFMRYRNKDYRGAVNAFRASRNLGPVTSVACSPFSNVDVRFSKNFVFQGNRIEFIAQLFNIFDRVNLATPTTNIGAGNDTVTGRPLFGTSTSLLPNINAPSRQAEFAVRFQF